MQFWENKKSELQDCKLTTAIKKTELWDEKVAITFFIQWWKQAYTCARIKYWINTYIVFFF